MIRLCIAGATGRMGRALLSEVKGIKFSIVGAITSHQNPSKGKTLKEIQIADSDTTIVGPENIYEAVQNADVYISFTNPKAEMENLPKVARKGVKIVMGTTGFTEKNLRDLETLFSENIPAVFAPNFSLGLNVLLKLIQQLRLLPESYDLSIVEAHHTGKQDAPSGTAKALGEVISSLKGYKEIVHGREGESPRKKSEVEILSVRAGGIQGMHQIIAAGPYDMIKLEHTVFSRNTYAQGALLAAEWLNLVEKPSMYSLDEVLGLL
jgi:4-hydroxy-tetrahydrodipicolinate reductase